MGPPSDLYQAHYRYVGKARNTCFDFISRTVTRD
jgi:hypothetical protein